MEKFEAEHNFLVELSQVVASSTELKPILDWIVQKTTSLLSTDDGSIKLLGPDSTPTARTIVRKQAHGVDSGSWELPIATSVMGFLLHRGGALASPDLLEDDRFPGLRRTQSRVRAVLAVPLRVGNRITGMLAVTNRTPGRQWTQEEVQLLDIVASNSAGAIEQARLREEEEIKKRLVKEQEQMDKEMRAARELQMGLVPSHSLEFGPWEVFGQVVPARQVGGDYFDYFELGPDRLGVAIADVSGKGVAAAILMANVQASLRAFCNGERDIPSAMRHVNHSVVRSSRGGKFITLFYGEVDAARGMLRYTNAGHNYPMLRRAGGAIEELTEGGLLLGLFEDADYEQGEVPFGPGDALLLYSDGISEALDTRGREFGEDRLRTVWQECGARIPADSLRTVLREVEQFRGSASQSDDITAVVAGPRLPA